MLSLYISMKQYLFLLGMLITYILFYFIFLNTICDPLYWFHNPLVGCHPYCEIHSSLLYDKGFKAKMYISQTLLHLGF